MIKNIIKENKYLYLYFILILIAIIAIITPTYAKFTHDFITDDDAVGITFDFNIKIQDIEEYERISIDSFDAKMFNVKITNNSNNNIYYGIWDRMIEPQIINNEIVIAKDEKSISNTSDSINGKESKIVTIVIKNKTDKKIKLDFGVSSSEISTNNIEYLDGKRLISGVDKITYLNEVLEGSFVNYTGNNGCSGNSCSGENANYVNKDNMGYCNNNKSKFIKKGWQLAYTEDESAHLISAASLECIATDEAGNISVNNKKTTSFEKTIGTPKHITNLNKEALKYCNEEFSNERICNNNTTWAINEKDLNTINNMPIKACYKLHSESCDGVNDIITGSGDYWIATNYEKTTTNYYWDGLNNYVFNGDTSNPFGLRVVVKLDPNTYIVDGDGTINNPYKIANEYIKKNN